MILALNTFFFYSLYSSYYIWFGNKDVKYISYCNSTLSSLLVLCSEKMLSSYIALELLSGYMIYDIIHIVRYKDIYKKNNGHVKCLTHHAITLLVINTSLPLIYPNITSYLLNMEITIPFINAAWFIKYYKQPKIYENLGKIMFILLYSFFRVYKLLYITIWHGYDTIHPAATLFLVSLLYINLLWYADILNKCIEQYDTSIKK